MGRRPVHRDLRGRRPAGRPSRPERTRQHRPRERVEEHPADGTTAESRTGIELDVELVCGTRSLESDLLAVHVVIGAAELADIDIPVAGQVPLRDPCAESRVLEGRVDDLGRSGMVQAGPARSTLAAASRSWVGVPYDVVPNENRAVIGSVPDGRDWSATGYRGSASRS